MIYAALIYESVITYLPTNVSVHGHGQAGWHDPLLQKQMLMRVAAASAPLSRSRCVHFVPVKIMQMFTPLGKAGRGGQMRDALPTLFTCEVWRVQVTPSPPSLPSPPIHIPIPTLACLSFIRVLSTTGTTHVHYHHLGVSQTHNTLQRLVSLQYFLVIYL